MVLPRVNSRTPLQPPANLGVTHQMSFVESIARKPRQRTVLISLICLVALTTYIFIANITFLLPPALRYPQDAPVADALTVALESMKQSKTVEDRFAYKKKVMHPFKLGLNQELAAVTSFIASLPQNVIPPTVDPTTPIDPQLVLDFDTNSPRAKDELRAMVEDVWSRNPVFLYAKHFSTHSREVKSILSGLNLKPEPTIIDTDLREDKEILVPLLARLTSTPELPVLLVGGKVVGSTKEIRRLHQDGGLQKMIAAAGAQIDGGKKKKHKSHIPLHDALLMNSNTRYLHLLPPLSLRFELPPPLLLYLTFYYPFLDVGGLIYWSLLLVLNQTRSASQVLFFRFGLRFTDLVTTTLHSWAFTFLSLRSPDRRSWLNDRTSSTSFHFADSDQSLHVLLYFDPR